MKFFFFILLFFFLFPLSVYSTTLTFDNDMNRNFVYSPGLEANLEYIFGGADRIRIYFYDSPIKQYFDIIDPNPDGGPRSVQLSMKLPDTLAPGRYELFLAGRELSESGAMISAVVSMRTRITVLALYPGVYPEWSLGTNDFNTGEVGSFSVSVNNLGTEQINTVKSSIDIYSPDNVLITTIYTDQQSVPSNTIVNLVASLNTSEFNLAPGIYKAVAHFAYDGIVVNKTIDKTFRIGSMYVDIVDWSKEVIVNVTNKFTMTIRSDWSGNINDVYAKINFPNGKNAKTPNVDLEKFQDGSLETYWEVKNLEIGSYDVPVEIFYNQLSTKKILKVDVINGFPPVIELPKSNSLFDNLSFKNFNTTYIILIVLVLLLLFNVYYFVFKKKGGGNNSMNSASANNMSANMKITAPPKP